MSENAMPPADERDQLIAEYALGVLSQERRAQVEALASRDAEVRAAIAAWQQHFTHWLDEVPHAAAPVHVWEAIETQLFPAPEPPKPANLWSNLRFWHWASAALAACLLVALTTLVQPHRPAASAMLARLEQSDGTLLFAATVQPDGHSVVFVPVKPTAWEGHSAQAWVIAADGKPHSLGLLPVNEAIALNIAQQLTTSLTRGAVLAVSLEPPSGSPPGLPTGPVIAKGKILPL